jgi:hypothetical protein
MSKESHTIKRLMLGVAIICTGAATALAYPPGEDILYPNIAGSPATGSGGSFFVQLELGANQSELYGANGIRSTDLTNNEVLGFQKSSNGTAPFGGVTLGYQFNSAFSIGVRLDYDSRFASNSGTATTLCSEHDPITDEPIGEHDLQISDKYEVSAKYFGVSLLPTLHFGDFLIYAGPSYMTPISRDIRQSFAIPDEDDDCQFFYGTDDATHRLSGRLTGSDNMLNRLSLKLGAGYGYPVAPNVKLMFQAGYDLGMSDLLGADETIELRNAVAPGESAQPMTIHRNLRLSSFQGSLGLRFNL